MNLIDNQQLFIASMNSKAVKQSKQSDILCTSKHYTVSLDKNIYTQLPIIFPVYDDTFLTVTYQQCPNSCCVKEGPQKNHIYSALLRHIKAKQLIKQQRFRSICLHPISKQEILLVCQAEQNGKVLDDVYKIVFWDIKQNKFVESTLAKPKDAILKEVKLFYFSQTSMICLASIIQENKFITATQLTYFKKPQQNTNQIQPIVNYGVKNPQKTNSFALIKINNKNGLMIFRSIQRKNKVIQCQYVICTQKQPSVYIPCQKQTTEQTVQDAWEYKEGTLFMTYGQTYILWNYKQNTISKLGNKLKNIDPGSNIQFVGSLRRIQRLKKQQPIHQISQFYPIIFLDPNNLQDVLENKKPENRKHKLVGILEYNPYTYIQGYLDQATSSCVMQEITVKIDKRP